MSQKKIFYLISSKGDMDWHELDCQIWIEKKSYESGELGYTMIENISCHICTNLNEYENVSFRIDFGKDSASGYEKNRKDFNKRIRLCEYIKWEFVSKRRYEKFRKELFEIYQKRIMLDISSITTK